MGAGQHHRGAIGQGGPVAQRAKNYFTLVKLNGRWYVSNLVWQDEGPQNPIPEELLRK
jgi:hypothetical protein